MNHELSILAAGCIGSLIGCIVTFFIEHRRNRRSERNMARILNDSYNHSLRQLSDRIAQKDKEIAELKLKLKNSLI